MLGAPSCILSAVALISCTVTGALDAAMKISKRFVKVGYKIIPGPLCSAVSGDHHIINTATGTLRQFGTRKRAETPSRPVAAHGISGLF